MSYLVDSDWIISGIAGRPAAIDLFASLRHDRFAISVVTVAEVLDGAYGGTDSAAMLTACREFLDGFPVLDVTEPVADMFARLRSMLRRRGRLIPDLDLLIAATALAHDLTLVSRNERHYRRVPGLRLHPVSR